MFRVFKLFIALSPLNIPDLHGGARGFGVNHHLMLKQRADYDKRGGMNLFNQKTLKRHIKPAPVPADLLAALDAWADMIRPGRVYALKEPALHEELIA
jgi:hypothetical protein